MSVIDQLGQVIKSGKMQARLERLGSIIDPLRGLLERSKFTLYIFHLVNSCDIKYRIE